MSAWGREGGAGRCLGAGGVEKFGIVMKGGCVGRFVCVCLPLSVSACMYVCLYVYMYEKFGIVMKGGCVGRFVCVCLPLSVSACMYVCLFVCI